MFFWYAFALLCIFCFIYFLWWRIEFPCGKKCVSQMLLLIIIIIYLTIARLWVWWVDKNDIGCLWGWYKNIPHEPWKYCTSPQDGCGMFMASTVYSLNHTHTKAIQYYYYYTIWSFMLKNVQKKPPTNKQMILLQKIK